MKISYVFIYVVLPSFLLNACTTNNIDHQAQSNSAQEVMQAMVNKAHADTDAPAMVAVLVHNDETLIAVSGHRTMRKQLAVTTTDRWHIGSISKMMTSALVARLVDKGQLRWDMTIGETLGEIEPDMHPQYHEATLIHFLAHRSGMSLTSDVFSNRMSRLTNAYLAQHGPAGPPPLGFEDGDFVGDPRIDRLHWTRAALQEPPIAALGKKKRIYENGNYIVIASILEHMFDISFETLMADELFGPLGMKRSGFGPPGRTTPIGGFSDPIGHQR